MSARITPEPMNTNAGHATALEAAFAEHAHLIHRVLLECKRPPDTWRVFQRLGVANDPEKPVAPDELVAACLTYMRAEQDERGEAKFRVQAWGRDEKGSEVRHVNLETGIEPPSTADQRASSETNALVATNEMLRRHCEDEHRQKMELFRVSIEVPKTVVEVIKAMPEAMSKSTAHYEMLTEALHLSYADKQEDRASAERTEDNRLRYAALEKTMAKLEPLAMAWLFNIMKEAGFDPSTIDPSAFGMGTPSSASPKSEPTSQGAAVIQISRKAETLRTFVKSLSDNEKAAIIDAFDDEDMGTDVLAIMFGAAEAKADEHVDACLRKLKERVAGKNAVWMGMTLRGIVGDRVAPLLPIFKPIWEEI